MLTADFEALVADILRIHLSARDSEVIRKARRKLAVVPTGDMVLYAHMVAAYIESGYESVPNVEWILGMPGSYLEELRAGFYPGDWSCLDYASDFYRAGVPAEMVVAAKNALLGIHGSSEWSRSDIVTLHRAGVPAAYVAEAGVIRCGVPAFVKLFEAGVSGEYASFLVNRGFKPKVVREAWAAGIPLEYVVP